MKACVHDMLIKKQFIFNKYNKNSIIIFLEIWGLTRNAEFPGDDSEGDDSEKERGCRVRR